jgi:hypothetical protein
MTREEFFQLDIEQLIELADRVGVGLQGSKSIEQVRTRLLNDAVFIG